MGSDIGAVYSVPLDELRILPGSQNDELAQLIAKDFPGRADIDEMFAGALDNEPGTLEAAVQHILDGKPLLEDRGPLYGYAVEGLCWAVGSTFFLPIGFPAYESVDEYLKAHGGP